MPLKAWIIQNEKSSILAHCALMTADLLKKNPRQRVHALFSALIYTFRLFKWRLSLAVVHPLNEIREMPVFLQIRKVFCKALKTHYYEVAMPVNLQPRHRRVFANNYYLLKPLKIMKLQGYWLRLTAYSGVVFKNYRILPESIHGRWAKTRKRLLKDYYRDTVGTWLQAYYGNSKMMTTQLPENRNYLLTHHWFNYYHWLTETMVRIWAVKNDLDDYTLLLPENLREIGFVQQSLEALKVRNIEWVKEGAILQIPNLTLVENKPYNGHYDPQQMQQLGAFFRNYAALQQPNHPDFGERIFITRKNAARRKMVNEAEIEDLLVRYGFRSVALEDFSLIQEVSILSKAKYVIGMHGAGLTNMLFMPPGGRVLELHLEITDENDMHSDVYWKLASALGHGYYYQFCRRANPTQSFFEADIAIDSESFEQALKIFVL